MLVWSYKENICHTCDITKQTKAWKLFENTYSVAEFSEAYSEASQTTKIEHFVETINSLELLAIFAEHSILEFHWVLNTALVLSHSY